jgi:tryptophan synthase alpha chain
MRLAEAFRRRPLLIAYICAGAPSPEATVGIAELLARAGADVVEIGLPPSTRLPRSRIQRRPEGDRCGDEHRPLLRVASTIQGHVPLVFMGYYNMVYQRGLDRFACDCGASGITGLIVPDLPPEEAGPLRAACRRADLDLISLVAPNTPAERIPYIAESSSGFLYLVARAGVTGARSEVLQSTKALIERVDTELPKAVGFGISTPEQAAEVIRAGADGAIVGSACVDLISRSDLVGLEELIRGMKARR